jgi:hypothetical protein
MRFGCQCDREELPRPDLPIVDGGYVHSSQQQSRADSWFEVTAGKVTISLALQAARGHTSRGRLRASE